MESRGCKKDGREQVFQDGLCEGNSRGRIAGGRQMDREGAGSEACERETDGVVIEHNVKLECDPKFCYLGDTLGPRGGVEEAERARVRCAWANFKELSPIPTARGASYRIKGEIYRACVQSVLTYGTETWAMKKENLRSLERKERMMVRWMWGVAEG